MIVKDTPTIRDRFLDDRLVDRAMRTAVREALLLHKRTGVGVVVWRSGRVVHLKPSSIKIYRGRSRTSGKTRSTRARTRAHSQE